MRGKKVFITGSSVGIGRYTAYEFARAGAELILTYNKSRREGENTANRCVELGAVKVALLHLDLRNSESIKACVREAVNEFGPIDILINNAGVACWKPLREQSFEEIEEQVRVNLEGLIKLTREALPHVKELIINVGSGAGKVGFPELSTYCATKFGVRGFTQSLAQEEESLKVITVNPGMTATRMTDYRGVSPEKVAKIIFRVVRGDIPCTQGGDVDLWDYL